MQIGSEVKSSKRTLEVLEFFADCRGAATTSEVSVALDMPQSSTSMLLGSLTKLNYLDYDPQTRTYRPTLRVMLLGAWMQEQLLHGGNLLSAMERIRRRTGLTVLIGVRQELELRYILVIRGNKRRVPIPLRSGVLIPLLRSSSGRVLLSLMDDESIARIVNHANAAMPKDAHMTLPALMRDIRKCRDTGWVENFNYPTLGLGSIATALPPLEGQPRMAIAAAGETAFLKERGEEIRAEVGAALRAMSTES